MSSPSHASPEQQSRATRTAPGRQTPPSVEADRTRSLESDHPHTTTTGRQTNAPVEADGRSSLEAEHPGNTPAICPTDQDAVTPQRTGVHGTIDKQSYDYMMRSGIAGGLAGCAAKTVVGPLDRVKILFQTSNPQFQKYTGSWTGVLSAMRSIHSTSGTRGLFRGHSATLLRIFPYAGIKFLAYEQVRAVVIKDPSQETPVRRFLSGSIAGTLSVFLTYPLEVVRVRLAFETAKDTRSSLASICRQIYHETTPAVRPPEGVPLAAATATVQTVTPNSGLANFYRGFTPTLWGMLPYAGASFLTHDYVKDWLRGEGVRGWTTLPRAEGDGRPRQLTGWAQLVAGGTAGFVSQTASYPLEVVRRRMQVGGVVGDGRRLSMAEVGAEILRERGWRGFFVGLGVGYVKVVPMVAVSFYVYERGKFYLGI